MNRLLKYQKELKETPWHCNNATFFTYLFIYLFFTLFTIVAPMKGIVLDLRDKKSPLQHRSG